MPVLLDDLDDAQALSDADREGLLRSAAMAGAQVRAVAEAQTEGVLEPLAALRPRAVVVVTGGSLVSARAAALVTALCGARFDAPIVVAPSLPGWIGPLDVVVVAGEDAGDPLLTDALARAARRRAEVVVLAPLEGPLREAAGIGRPGAVGVLDLSPRVFVEARFRFVGQVAGLVAVLVALTAVRLTPAPPELRGIADALDAEAAVGHPAQESFHNQAKLLAVRAAGHRCVWTGDTAGALAAAAQVAAAFFDIAGRPVGVAEESAVHALLAAGAGADPAAALFHDPEIDGPSPDRLRAFLVTLAARSWAAEQRSGGHDIDVVTERAEPAAEQVAGGPSGTELLADTPADLDSYLVVVVRAQLAAAYLALTGQDG